MLHTFAVSNYRSLREIALTLAPLTVITGANGTGKSNLYRALHLVQHAAQGTLAQALAIEGGIESTQFAGTGNAAHQVKQGHAIQGTRRKGPVRVRFGFATDEICYEIALGLPTPSASRFSLDPEVKGEWIWQRVPRRRGNTWLEREGPRVSLRDRGQQWVTLDYAAPPERAILGELGEPERFPEVFALREHVRRWRFYDGFRTDPDSPLRHPRVATRTLALHHDGSDLAAALQTILEIGDGEALRAAVADAFDGADLVIDGVDARMQVGLRTPGLLRTLGAMELSDGTLRYLCLLAALHSPRPPPLLVLNEPEQSLHPDLLVPLAAQIAASARRSQVWVISHAPRLVAAIADAARVDAIELVREFGETRVRGQGLLDGPVWP